MAKAPQHPETLIGRYGPNPNYTPSGGWQKGSEAPPDQLVKTHCCFCGQQCGIQLKVRDNRVVGFEPWDEFPFNQGKLCPKGVKRYMQNEHPDRLLAPLMRAPNGDFREAKWDEALDFTAQSLRAIQEMHGKDAVAIYGGASLTSEKSYLLGKFARVALGTRHIDYNGRLCMVSAGTAYKLAFGVDRSPNPWSDIPKAQVVLVTGANVAECAPITTDYLWRMRDHGGKLIVITDAAGAVACADIAKHIIMIPACDPFIAPLVYSVPIQLLTYFTAVHKGTDVDQPRNLAKSVTVE